MLEGYVKAISGFVYPSRGRTKGMRCEVNVVEYVDRMAGYRKSM
jgi:hypothetical protein